MIALTRAVSPTLESCELTWLPREPIEIGKAIEQHDEYERALAELGLHVISLPAEPELPDATFVEDPLVVVDEVAIVTRMGAASRRPESESLAAAISPFRPVRRLREPATLEGGDVMRIGRDVFVGLSTRTNEAGIAQCGRTRTLRLSRPPRGCSRLPAFEICLLLSRRRENPGQPGMA